MPGIGYSPDRMLQARLFSYGDAQRYRLGVNHHQIPVNAPRGVACPHGFHRDGAMRVDGNAGSENAYEPNSYGNWQDSRELSEPVQAGGDVAMYDFREDDHNYYTQPGMLWRAMTPEQQLVLCENTARAMGDSTLQIKHRHIFNCYHADPDYGRGVAQALGIDIDSVDLDGATADSYELWLARKRNAVELTESSSLRMFAEMEPPVRRSQTASCAATTMRRRRLPIALRGTGVIGSICVSGFDDHLDDHQLVINTLAEYLA